jgi:hypothetical protein
MSSNLNEKLNREIEKETTKIGKKVVEKQVQDKLGELDEKTDKHLAGLQAKLSAGVTKSGLTMISTVYFLLFLEHVPVLLMLVLVYFFSVILSILLLMVIIIVGGIYLVSYIIIYRFPKKLQKGSTGFFFALILSICEAFMMAYLTQVVDEVLLMIILGIVLIILLVNTILAKILKNKYKSYVGALIGVGISVGLYALYMFSFEYSWTFIVVSFCLLIIYQAFLVIVANKIIHFYELEENFTSAVFVTLVVYKKKIDYTFGLIFIIGKVIFKCCQKKNNY